MAVTSRRRRLEDAGRSPGRLALDPSTEGIGRAGGDFRQLQCARVDECGMPNEDITRIGRRVFNVSSVTRVVATRWQHRSPKPVDDFQPLVGSAACV